MGNYLNEIIFMPQDKDDYKLSRHIISKADKNYFLKTKNNSFIEVIEIHKKNNNTKENNEDENNTWMILSHANAESLYNMAIWCYHYLEQKLNINFIIYEYTGYNKEEENMKFIKVGNSYHLTNDLINENEVYNGFKHFPKQEYVFDDIETIYNHLINSGVKSSNIIAFGRSLGSAPSIYLSTKFKIRGLITSSAFTSILRVAFPLRFNLFFDKFNNLELIKKVMCPTCIIHSVQDEIVPFEHALDLYNSLENKFPPLFVIGSKHNTIDYLPEVIDHIFNFINLIFKN